MLQLFCNKVKSLQGVPFHCHIPSEHLNPCDIKKEKPNLPNPNTFIAVLADVWIFLVLPPVS